MRQKRATFTYIWRKKKKSMQHYRVIKTYHFKNAAESLDDILAEECRVSLSNILGDTVDEIQNRKFDIGLNLYENKLTPL